METAFDRLLNAAIQLKPGVIAGKSDLAKFLNESPQTITNWQSRGLPRAKILDVAKAIGVTPEWLLDGSGPMTPQERDGYRDDTRATDAEADTNSATGESFYIHASSPEDLAVKLAEKGNEEIARIIQLLLTHKDKFDGR